MFLNNYSSFILPQLDTENPDKILTIELDDESVSSVLDAVKKAGYKIYLR
jgi:hypothetical protein